jgi:hypothetical protein
MNQRCWILGASWHHGTYSLREPMLLAVNQMFGPKGATHQIGQELQLHIFPHLFHCINTSMCMTTMIVLCPIISKIYINSYKYGTVVERKGWHSLHLEDSGATWLLKIAPAWRQCPPGDVTSESLVYEWTWMKLNEVMSHLGLWVFLPGTIGFVVSSGMMIGNNMLKWRVEATIQYWSVKPSKVPIKSGFFP